MPTGATADPYIRGRTTNKLRSRRSTVPPWYRGHLEGRTVPSHVGPRGPVHITGTVRLGSYGRCEESPVGLANRRDQPSLFAIWLEPFREARRLVGGGGVTARTRRTGSAAGARMRSLPWLVRMVLADPAGVLAQNASHVRFPGGNHFEKQSSTLSAVLRRSI